MNALQQSIRDELVEYASSTHAKWPAYKGHFDDYCLVRVRRRIRTKLGLAFVKGELAVANYKPILFVRHQFTSITVFSVRNNIDTGISFSDVEVIK